LKEGGGGLGTLSDRFLIGFVSEYLATFSAYVFDNFSISMLVCVVGTFVIA